ncbi:MAG: VWA domain-containing protein [Bacteroidia bacterium]|nr:VWA domain-containing protein [Bacteroidia bacterium]
MKKIVLSLIFLGMLFSSSTAQVFTNNDRWNEDDPYYGDYINDYTHKIQIALILDVSGSMDGLLEQAKSQLWTVVNAIMFDESMNGYPLIEIALMEYGNNRNYQDGYMRVLVPFTSNLDWIAEDLFSLRTGGSREFAPRAVSVALNNLNWSYSREDLKLVYIAGNERFHQGGTNFQVVARQARNKDIVVNTIFCGDHYYGKRQGWAEAAYMTQGDYMNIEQNYRPHYSDNIYSDQLFSLNNQLNQTYIPFGTRGSQCFQRQRNLDRRAGNYGRGYASQRFITKSTGAYLNPEWDLVDAVVTGSIKLQDIPNNDLPPEMRRMSLSEKRNFINSKLNKRKKVQAQMRSLGKKQLTRTQSHAANKGRTNGSMSQSSSTRPQSLDQAIIKSTRHQQEVKGQRSTTSRDQILNRPPRPSSNNHVEKKPVRPSSQTSSRNTYQPKRNTIPSSNKGSRNNTTSSNKKQVITRPGVESKPSRSTYKKPTNTSRPSSSKARPASTRSTVTPSKSKSSSLQGVELKRRN